MPEHTPGPWNVLDGWTIWGAGDHRLKQLAEVETAFPEHEANARLMAAAPDMLAALKAAVAFEDLPPERHLRMLDAIAKAEGRDA